MQWDLDHPADAVEAANRFEEIHGKRSEFFKDLPAFSMHQQRVWLAWSILHSSRQLAFEGFQSLSMTDIEVIGKVYKIELESFFAMIQALDSAWISWYRSKD